MRIAQFRRRNAAIVVATFGWYLLSCTEVPTPEGGGVSISTVRRPSPGLVAGDTLRDSTGLVAPLSVIAYGLDDQPLDPQPAVTFVSLDTIARLAGNYLIGNTTGTARVVGIVGSLQTRVDSIPVTLSPDTIVGSDSVLHRVSYTLAGDTVVNSGELGTLVQHRLPTTSPVQAVVVRYAITKAPVGNSAPTALIVTGNRASDRDTTDTQGKASRVARLRLGALSSFVVDTVMVDATASYRGRTLGVVTFTVIFTKQ